MAQGPDNFIKVSLRFPEHPKTLELSDRAFRRLIEAWIFCFRNRNDGLLTNAQKTRLFSQKVCCELVAVGYLERVDSGWQMHDYLDHQASAAQLADLHNKRVAAGSRGGRAAASARASASDLLQQTSSRPVPELEIEKEELLTTGTQVRHVSNAQDDHSAQDEPRSSPVPIHVASLSKRYTDVVRLSDRGKVCAVILNAVSAGFTEDEIGPALDRLAAAERAVTADTLRIEIRGLPSRASPPSKSTSDQRVSQALDLAQRYAAQEAREESQRLEIEA